MRGILITAVMLASGCAGLMQERLPEDYDGRSEPKCTGVGPSVLDIIVAGAGVTTAIIGGRSDSLTQDERYVSIGVGSLMAVVFSFSAGYGFSHASDCAAAKKQWRGE